MVLRVADPEAGAVRGGDGSSERSLTEGALVSACPLAGARANMVEERLDVVGWDDRVAVDADEVAASGCLQTAVKCLSDAPARAVDEANMRVPRHPALDDPLRAVGGVVVDDDHLD